MAPKLEGTFQGLVLRTAVVGSEFTQELDTGYAQESPFDDHAVGGGTDASNRALVTPSYFDCDQEFKIVTRNPTYSIICSYLPALKWYILYITLI